MKDLLEQLQQYPKTWGRFEHNENYSYLKKDLIVVPEYIGNALIEKLLTDFCDGEGYQVWSYPFKDKWLPNIYFSQSYELPIELKPQPSRQEAFNEGLVKAFSLMENKGDNHASM